MLKKLTFHLSENIKLNNYWFWMSFLAFSFHSVCFLYVWMKFPEMQDEIPLTLSKLTQITQHLKKTILITYS